MEITWYGMGAFQVKTQDGTIVINPYKDSTVRKLGDITVLTRDDRSAFNEDLLAKSEGYIADWPGEYEISNIMLTGVEIEEEGLTGVHSVFSIKAEGITVCHLNSITKTLPQSKIQKLGDVDILLIPFGKEGTLDMKTAVKVVEELEPKIVIPANYGDDTDLEKFLTAMGSKNTEKKAAFKVKSSDLGETMEVVTLLQG